MSSSDAPAAAATSSRVPPTPTPDEGSPAALPSTDDPTFVPAGEGGTAKALAKLLQQSPFLDLHERAGSPADHRLRGGACFVTDFVLRLAVVVLLLAVIAAVAWRALAPLPKLWS
jgi:hypothetical protein